MQLHFRIVPTIPTEGNVRLVGKYRISNIVQYYCSINHGRSQMGAMPSSRIPLARSPTPTFKICLDFELIIALQWLERR